MPFFEFNDHPVMQTIYAYCYSFFLYFLNRLFCSYIWSKRLVFLVKRSINKNSLKRLVYLICINDI